MDLISDFLLLAASLSACFYCWMLSKRLKKLKSSRNGIAASLASLSKSVEEAKKAIAHSHVAAEESVARLEPLVLEARQMRAELTYDLETLSQSIAAERAQLVKMRAQTAADVRKREASGARAGERTDAAGSVEGDPSEAAGSEFEIEWRAEEACESGAGDDAPPQRDVISLSGAAA